MKTIESIINEITKLHTEFIKFKHEGSNKGLSKAFEIRDRICGLGEEVFSLWKGTAFWFEWMEDGVEYSSEWIKLGGQPFISGDTLISGRLEIDLRTEGMGLDRIFDVADDYGIELEWNITSF